MSGYTPTKAQLSNQWALHRGKVFDENDLAPFHDEFDRWLASVKAGAAATALDDLAEEFRTSEWATHIYPDDLTQRASELRASVVLGTPEPAVECAHERTHMRGWTQVCDDCGKGREVS